MKLTLTNFQCHEHLEVEFDEHVTTILGQTDAGKSAIIRALIWLCTNRPSGDSFIRKGSKFVRVKLEIDQHSLVRKKGEKTNCYIVDGKKHQAMGLSVPDSITEILNLNEINFQSQHDSAFWFSQSAGQVSKELNSIINLGSIDEVLTNIGQRLRKSKANVDLTQDRLSQAVINKQTLSWVPIADCSLQELERSDNNLNEFRNKQRLLCDLILGIVSHNKTALLASKEKLCVEKVQSLGAEALELNKRQEPLKKLMGDYSRADKVTKIKLPDLQPLETLTKQIEKRQKEQKQLSPLIEEHKRLDKAICQNLSSVKSGEKELTKQMKGKCPVCLQPIISEPSL